MKLRFYFAPDTCALATHIALIDVGADYELSRIDFSRAEQSSAEFLEVNPKGRVPALVTPSGVLTETPAMLVYVAQAFQVPQLARMCDEFEFARLQSFMRYLCSTLHVAHAHRMRGHRWADDAHAIAAMQGKVPDSVSAAYEFIEAHALEGPFVMGDEYCVADPYLFTIAQWMEADGVDVSRFPRVLAHRELIRARPAVQQALREELDR